MRLSSLVAPLVAVLSLSAYGQQLSTADRELIQSARKRYYNLEAAGFQSLKCSVKFDLSTVPLLSPDKNDPTRKLLEATKFTLVLEVKGRTSVEHQYPVDASENARQRSAQATTCLRLLLWAYSKLG